MSRTYEEAVLRATTLGYDGTVGSDTMIRDYWPKVVYRPRPDAAPEEGVVTRVTDRFVFVRYGSDVGAKATAAEVLEPLMKARTQ